MSSELADERAKIYQILADAIQDNLHNIKVLKLTRLTTVSTFGMLATPTKWDKPQQEMRSQDEFDYNP